MPRTTRGACPEQQGEHAQNNKGACPEQQGEHAQNKGTMPRMRGSILMLRTKKISTKHDAKPLPEKRDTTLYLNQNGRFTIFPSTLFTRKLAPWRRFERWSMHQQYQRKSYLFHSLLIIFIYCPCLKDISSCWPHQTWPDSLCITDCLNDPSRYIWCLFVIQTVREILSISSLNGLIAVLCRVGWTDIKFSGYLYFVYCRLIPPELSRHIRGNWKSYFSRQLRWNGPPWFWLSFLSLATDSDERELCMLTIVRRKNPNIPYDQFSSTSVSYTPDCGIVAILMIPDHRV